MEVSSCSSGRMMEWLVGPLYGGTPSVAHEEREIERDRIVAMQPYTYTAT